MYAAIGANAEERHKAYHEYASEKISEEELNLIRDSIQLNQITGGSRFRDTLEKKLNIRLSNLSNYRPKKMIT